MKIENAAMREIRWIILIKNTRQQLKERWETWNKADTACLLSLCRQTSIFWMTSTCFVYILPIFFWILHLPPWIGIWHSKAIAFFFTLLNNWNSSHFFPTHTRNPSHSFTHSLRQNGLSDLWKGKHQGWSGGVWRGLSRGSVIWPMPPSPLQMNENIP